MNLIEKHNPYYYTSSYRLRVPEVFSPVCNTRAVNPQRGDNTPVGSADREEPAEPELARVYGR